MRKRKELKEFDLLVWPYITFLQAGLGPIITFLFNTHTAKNHFSYTNNNSQKSNLQKKVLITKEFLFFFCKKWP